MLGDPALAGRLRENLRIPVMAAPMYIASTPELVIAQCRAGIIGAIPALNFRTPGELEAGLSRIGETLRDCHVPWAVNVVAHRSNDRLEADLAAVLRHKVPIVVLALAASREIVEAVHAYGGLVFNDVATVRQARKCAELGVDGIVAVAAGAGGHTGAISPFALMAEIREFWRGPLALAGAIANGRAVLAAETLGADLAYVGSPFLATEEANTQAAFRQMIVDGASDDVVVTNCFTGAPASFLRQSLLDHGLDPKKLARPAGAEVNIAGGGSNTKAWRDIWSAGQGIGAVKSIGSTQSYVDWLAGDYARARNAMRIAPRGEMY